MITALGYATDSREAFSAKGIFDSYRNTMQWPPILTGSSRCVGGQSLALGAGLIQRYNRIYRAIVLRYPAQKIFAP